MNLEKHLDFFDPGTVKKPIHIIGVGAIGSHIAELLVRIGLQNIILYDFDCVEDKNITNQMFITNQIGKPKVEAVAEMLVSINPNIAKTLKLETEGYDKQKLTGYVFICVDTIEVRQKIVDANMYNQDIIAMFDFRMRLTDAQYYAADWQSYKQKKSLRASMDFTQAEADEATPINACGGTLAIIPTIKTITSLGVANFINYIQEGILTSTILIDAFTFDITAMGNNT